MDLDNSIKALSASLLISIVFSKKSLSILFFIYLLKVANNPLFRSQPI